MCCWTGWATRRCAPIGPHGGYLADTRPKLQALARYAELHGHHFVRIESIVKVGNALRVLDLHDPAVRAEVMEFDGAQVASPPSQAL